MSWLLALPIALLGYIVWRMWLRLIAFQVANHRAVQAIMVYVRRRERKRVGQKDWRDSFLETEALVERTSVLPEIDADRLRKESGPR